MRRRSVKGLPKFRRSMPQSAGREVVSRAPTGCGVKPGKTAADDAPSRLVTTSLSTLR